MTKTQLVATSDEARANIDRYEAELSKSPDLQAIMSYVRAWHGYQAADGSWRVAPSKYVGYAENSADAYLRSHGQRDGRRTERALSTWSYAAGPGTAAFEDIKAAVLRLFAKHGRTPNKLFRVSVLKSDRDLPASRSDGTRTGRANIGSRITVDSGICSGRPTIRGMRIRVIDILDMLAAGVSRQEILADYPYLEDDDISAALDYAARSADHRIVSAA